MSWLVRLCLALAFLGLSAVSLLYAVSAAPASTRGAIEPIAFAWTAADGDCFEAYEQCDGAALIARAGSAPLSARPFAMQLVSKIVSGDEQGAEAIAEQVLARDPRSRDARQVLAAAALRRGDREAFLQVFLPLFDVDRMQGEAYADFLAGISKDPALRAALAPRLVAEPPWAAAYLNALARRGGLSVSELIPLYRGVPRAQATLLGLLAKEGKWDTAYIAFADFVSSEPESSRLDLSVPFNPDFRESQAQAPFNWSLPSRSTQIQKGGGVYVFYEGRKAETLLTQTFPLSPGSWALAFEQSGELAENGGSFRWLLACAGGGPALAQFDVRRLKAASEQSIWRIDLPPGSCPYLTVSLRGVPGAFPQPARLEMTSVRLSKASGESSAP